MANSEEASSDVVETAGYFRGAMEQRRTVEVGLFGALTSFQIAMAALVTGQADKPADTHVSWFVAVCSMVLWALYIALVGKIEVLNRANRLIYLRMQDPDADHLRRGPGWRWQDFKDSWAAWPTVAATVIELALLALLLTLP